MKFYYFSPNEKAYQRAMGLAAEFVLAGDKMKEFTTTTEVPVHSDDYRLVFETDLY
ncbi:MAG: hypothetical protein PHE02_15185 [Lachnospiraceae bacterium]|nr:hypothetical protein [Lachnospiraceae bacterium]